MEKNNYILLNLLLFLTARNAPKRQINNECDKHPLTFPSSFLPEFHPHHIFSEIQKNI